MKSLLALITLIGIVLLQIYLSEKENKWVGLVIPGICLIISILAILGMACFFTLTKETATTINNNGEIINKVISNTMNKNNMGLTSVIFSSIIVFLMYNIPTAIFLAIYVGCHKKTKDK